MYITQLHVDTTNSKFHRISFVHYQVGYSTVVDTRSRTNKAGCTIVSRLCTILQFYCRRQGMEGNATMNEQTNNATDHCVTNIFDRHHCNNKPFSSVVYNGNCIYSILNHGKFKDEKRNMFEMTLMKH